MSENDVFSACVEVNGWSVWYDKYGSGPKPVLLIPGPIGTGRTDFVSQLEGECALDEDLFTIIAVELPGWGRSRPPVRKYGTGVYDNDAQCLHTLMKDLGFEKYSIISWSDGANVAIRMATTYPQSVVSMVLTSVYTIISNDSLKALLLTQNVDQWPKDKLKCYLQSYDNKSIVQQLWTRYLKFVEYYNQYFPESKNNLQSIKCRVLIIYGQKDIMCTSTQMTKMKQSISRSSVYRIPNGDHNCHQKYSSIYKDVVEDYLMGRYKQPDNDNENSSDVMRHASEMAAFHPRE